MQLKVFLLPLEIHLSQLIWQNTMKTSDMYKTPCVMDLFTRKEICDNNKNKNETVLKDSQII